MKVSGRAIVMWVLAVVVLAVRGFWIRQANRTKRSFNEHQVASVTTNLPPSSNELKSSGGEGSTSNRLQTALANVQHGSGDVQNKLEELRRLIFEFTARGGIESNSRFFGFEN